MASKTPERKPAGKPTIPQAPGRQQHQQLDNLWPTQQKWIQAGLTPVTTSRYGSIFKRLSDDEIRNVMRNVMPDEYGRMVAGEQQTGGISSITVAFRIDEFLARQRPLTGTACLDGAVEAGACRSLVGHIDERHVAGRRGEW
jgi:hypothetical protein